MLSFLRYRRSGADSFLFLTMNQLFTPEGLLEPSLEFTRPVYMCLVDFAKASDGVTWVVDGRMGCIVMSHVVSVDLE